MFEEIASHAFHIHGTNEDAKLLKPHPVIGRLVQQFIEDGHSQQRIVRLVDNKVNVWCSKKEIDHNYTWRGWRMRITEADVNAIRKATKRACELTSNDVLATEALVSAWGEEVVIKYLPQPLANGITTADLLVIVCSPYQREMIRKFGSRLIFMDFTN